MAGAYVACVWRVRGKRLCQGLRICRMSRYSLATRSASSSHRTARHAAGRMAEHMAATGLVVEVAVSSLMMRQGVSVAAAAPQAAHPLRLL